MRQTVAGRGGCHFAPGLAKKPLTGVEELARTARRGVARRGADRPWPDVAVVDLGLAPKGRLDWLRALRQVCPGLEVIVLSVHDEEAVRRAMLAAGADAFVLERAIATELLPVVARAGRSTTCSSG